MPYPNLKWLHFITDKDRKPYFIGPNGEIDKRPQTDGISLALNQHPDGWRNIETSFATNFKYWSLNRSFTAPFTYINDGAKILRYLNYKGRGFEEEVYALILKWDDTTGKFIEEYFGRIDMLLDEDEPAIGMHVSTKEGGLHSYLAANDGVTYTLPCDETNPDAIRVLFDGVDLFDKYNYSFYEFSWGDITFSFPGGRHSIQFIMPIVFLNNEGDSIGIVKGNQEFEETGTGSFFQDSNNNIYYTVYFPTDVKIEGTVKLIYSAPPTFEDAGYASILAVTSLGHSYTLATTGIKKTVVLTINSTIHLEVNERLFIVYDATLAGFYNLTTTNLSLSFTSKNIFSTAWFIPPLPALKQLVSKTSEGKYTADSNFFRTHSNLVIGGGESLRELKDATLKTTFQDFFDDYDADYCLGMRIVNNVLWIEPKKDLYNDSTQIFNLGKVSKLKITRPDELIGNTIKFGSPVQDYNERNGKFEFNDTKEWKAPITAKKAEINHVGKYRRDGYGMEFIRGKLNQKDTTDNKGDNEVFKVNVEKHIVSFPFVIQINESDPHKYSLTITGHNDLFRYFFIDEKITLSNTQFNNNQYTIVDASILSPSQFRIWLSETLVVTGEEVLNGTIEFFTYILTRRHYDPLIGVLTQTIFNVEEMTPARQFRAWMSYFNSIFFQQSGDKITFQTGDKNKDLSTTLGSLIITEKEDIVIGTVDAPFFLPFNIGFDSKVPGSFSRILKQANAGDILLNYNGFDLWCLPIGEMKSRPVTNEAQEWTLLASVKNSLDTLLKLSSENLVALDSNKNFLMYSILNPVQLVYYGKTLDPKYHFKDMYDDWLHHRNTQFADQPAYLQKWQITEKIPFQIITRNVSDLELFIYDVNAKEVDTIPFTSMTEAGLQLPYVKKQAEVNLSTYGIGRFLYVVKSGGTSIFISEWQEVAVDQRETYLITYSHSTNRQDAYFSNFKPCIRVEAFWEPDGTETVSTDYIDEPGNIELLHGETYSKMKLHVGFPWGIPDWMEKKLSNILMLDNVDIESTKYVKPSDSKLTPNKRNGYPMPSYTVDLRKAVNDDNLMIEGIDLPGSEGKAMYTIDAEAFGQGAGVIKIELP